MTLARWALGGSGLAVGIGQNAHGALILAAGGGCDRVAIVDGLWGPWADAAASVDEMYSGIRRLLEDGPATAPPPSSGLDPRTSHGYGVTMSRVFAQRFWGAITCPVLAIETPASTTPADERAERVGWFAGAASLVEVSSTAEGDVVAELVSWSQATSG
jgi:hypothetical protein